MTTSSKSNSTFNTILMWIVIGFVIYGVRQCSGRNIRIREAREAERVSATAKMKASLPTRPARKSVGKLIEDANEAIERLESEVVDFDNEDWRDNVPEVEQRVRDMRWALDALIKGVESDLVDPDDYPDDLNYQGPDDRERN